MAVNKRKVLDAARKYAQKGAKEKALKEYNTLLKLDPRDAKLHLEIGDCYRRWGQIDEAVTQYSRVAEQYKGDGFDARAVAVFKQILNLDPKLYTAHVSLSELYQRMGLDAEALNALQAAADGYHRDGDKQQALELLRRMATLDPTNTTSRLKVAELLRQEGLEDEAVAEYEAVAAEFTRQGATESFLTAQERILDLRPDRADVLMSIARGLIELKKPERAEPFAKHAVDLEPQNVEIQEILCDVYRVLGNTTELAAATRKLAQVYQDKGDEDKARELMQRIPTELDGGGAAGAGESAMLTDGELLLDDAPAIPGSGPTDGLGPDDDLELEFDDEPGDEGDDFILDDELDDSLDDLDDSGAADPPLPEGDPEQLFAEASVYLRYGKREQAIASLEAVLQQEADHRPALEKLGEAYVELDRNGDAVEIWCRAAELARTDGDDPGFEVLRDRIGAIDAKAAEQLGHAGGAGASAASVDVEADSGFDPDDDVELELDVTVPDEVEAADGNAEADTEEDVELDLDAGAEADEVEVDVDGGIEIELDDGETEEDVAVEVDDADADEDIEIDVDDADAEEVEIDVDAEIEVDVGIDLDDAPTEDEAVSEDDSSDPERISEELEEAEFYYQQGLFDEAEAVYRRILKVAPENANALQRIAELAEARGEDPSSAAPSPEPEPEPEKIAKPKAKKRGKAKSPPAVTEVEAPAAADVEDRTEVADVSADAADDEAVVQIDTPPAARPGQETAVAASARGASAERSTQKVAGAAAATSDDTGHFDLAAELRDVLEEDDDDSSGSSPNASAVQSTVEEGLESLFADFKQGVSAALSEDDYETRYDLGIAYREMELYEDAIGEFKLCLESESRKVDSLHMMGLSALDLGRAEDAANHLDQALATPGLADERRAGIRFDLGRVYEVRGDLDRARSSYEAVVEHDPDFPGAQERLDALSSGGGGDAAAASSGGGGFESFDDLVADANFDANSDADTQEAESFESFDDVISEAAGEADSEPEPDAKPGKKRKKKISFV